jgi:anti-sigma factor RsiW
MTMTMHWFHMAMGRGRQLAAYAANELSPEDRSRLETVLAACPACRGEVEAYRLISTTLQTSAPAALSPHEAATFWSGVERRIQQGVAARVRPARPALREFFWDHPRLSLASAAAAVVLVLGLTLNQLEVWGPWSPVGPNGVEVVSVEAGEDASVMVFQAPGSSLKVIWVFEKPSS